MKVLWVSYIFPPYGGREGQQGACLVRELVRRGVDVEVLTIRPCRGFPGIDGTLLDVVPESVRVHRTSAGLFSLLRHASARPGGLGSYICGLCALLNNVEWIPIGWRYLRRCHGPYDGIYSLGDPVSCHVVAALAKRRFGGRLLLDYGDPYALKPPRQNVSRFRLMLQRWLEGWCLRHADVVGMRVEANGAAYKRIFPFLADIPFVTMYGGIDQEAFDRLGFQRSSDFSILYTGQVYGHTVGVCECLKGVSLARQRGCDLKLRFVGTAREHLLRHAPRQLLEVGEFLGYESAADTMRLQKGATVLLAFGFSYPYAIPSKISEYLAARRPVVCVEEARNPCSGLVAKYQRGVSVRPDPEEIARVLGSLHEDWRRGNLDDRFRLGNEIPEITWRQFADSILSALRGTVHSHDSTAGGGEMTGVRAAR